MPNLRRNDSSSDFFHRRVIIVADPNPRHQLRREADEPCVLKFLAGARFPRRHALGQRSTRTRSPTHHVEQHVVHHFHRTIGDDPFFRGRFVFIELFTIARFDTDDAIWHHFISVVRQMRIGTG